MRQTINKYISRGFLSIFLLTLAVLTFVMCVGGLLRGIDLMARGISRARILMFFLQSIPHVLSFSIPISVLVASLLLFGRLSSDSEIVAMKASGMRLGEIVAPVVVWALGLSLICLLFTCFLGPSGHFANHKILKKIGVNNLSELLEEGTFIRDLPGLMIYVSRKEGNTVEDVLAYKVEDGRIVRSIRAESGVIEANKKDQKLSINLRNVRIEDKGTEKSGGFSDDRYINAEYYPLKLDVEKIFKTEEATKNRDELYPAELLARIKENAAEYARNPAEGYRIEHNKLMLEANTRLALGFSCLTFALLGIPLGICSHRKESSIGLALSLAVVVGFYCFILLAEGVSENVAMRPELIVWLPVVGGQLAGLWMLHRSN